MPIYTIYSKAKTLEQGFNLFHHKRAETDIKKIVPEIICDNCNTKTFSLTGRVMEGNYGVGKVYLLKCKNCKGELGIGVDVLR